MIIDDLDDAMLLRLPRLLGATAASVLRPCSLHLVIPTALPLP